MHPSSLGLHRTKSQVFVEIPPSPLFKARVASTHSKVDVLSTFHIPDSHKENAPPPSTKTSNILNDSKGKTKRKAQDDDHQATLPGAKKAKIPEANNKSEIVACHQCRSKKPSDSVLQCTGTSKRTGNRCKASYCDTCLRNRYGKELRTITKRNTSESQGDSGTKYQFICPRCDGNCNCAPCRKRRGLGPVGKFTVQGGESVREILERDPGASGVLPKYIVASAPKVLKLSKVDDTSTISVDAPDNAAKGSAKISSKKPEAAIDMATRKKLKAAPEPVWLPVPQMLSKHEIEGRIHLREFVLRFNPILNIGPRNLEELDDFTSLHDSSTKAILLSLLDILAIEDETQKKKIQETVKTIRSLGPNWAKIIAVLYDLRGSMPKDHALSAVPDPCLSNTKASHATRGARRANVSADQLLPVLLYLIQVAGEGPSVRQELEEGSKQAKEVRAAYFKATREETERWSTEKAELIEKKPEAETRTKESINSWKVKFRNAEAKHRAIIADIQHSHKPELDWCAPRFASLGYDIDGRIYYALSALGPQRGKKERLPSESERFALRKWGWFIAVYGKPGTVIQQDSDDMAEEDESNHERWWGFADVKEMRKLSKWLAYYAEADISNNGVGNTKSTNPSTEPTATSSTLASLLPSSSGTTAMSRFESRPLSPRSHSDSRSHGMDIDRDHDRNLTKPVTLAEMKTLAKAVLEFADFIDWRLNRG